MTSVALRHTADRALFGLSWHDVSFFGTKGRVTSENLRECGNWAIELAARYGSKIGLIVWIAEAAPVPDEAGRQALEEIYSLLAPRACAQVHIIDGVGFRSAVVRGVLTGVNALTRKPFPIQVTGDLREALTWLLPRMPPSPARGSLDEAFRVFSGALAAAHPG